MVRDIVNDIGSRRGEKKDVRKKNKKKETERAVHVCVDEGNAKTRRTPALGPVGKALKVLVAVAEHHRIYHRKKRTTPSFLIKRECLHFCTTRTIPSFFVVVVFFFGVQGRKILYN